ncbi:MAG: RNA pyrophosphohydrolase [Rhodobacteraceae bacterium]|nr:RNA pyrophosphohydrolase [Paracoccaceae bacterium]
MTPGDLAALPYRPCVGVVLINASGRVFAGQRADTDAPAWQMPQGGVDKGEGPQDAAYRELWEETGIARGHVTHLAETADWLCYDLPVAMIPRIWGGTYRGQRQKWFLMRMDAPDTVINLHHRDREFAAWRWMTAAALLRAIVPFKRAVYAQVFREFGLG